MTDIVRQLTIKAEAQGADQAAASIDKVAAATNKAASATDRLTGTQRPSIITMVEAAKSSLNLDRASASQAARLDIAERAQQRYNRELTAANRFRAAGIIDETEHTKRLGLAAEAQRAMTRGLEVTTSAQGLSRIQMFETLAVLKGLTDSTAAGINPLRALAFESGRIGEVFGFGGGVGPTFLAFKETLSAAIGPMTATKAALFGIGGGALAAVGGAILLHHEIDVALEKMEKLVAIGAGAAKAGVGTSFFQAWTSQAKELNLETSDLIGILEHARKASTTSIGEDGKPPKNTTRERIQQNVAGGFLDKSALSGFDATNSFESRSRFMLDLLDELEKKAKPLARFDLAKTFFGDSFELQLRNGVDMIGRMRTSLDGLAAAGGARIISEAEIKRAEEMKKKIEDIHNQIAKDLIPLQDELRKAGLDWLSILVLVNKGWDNIVKTMSGVAVFVDIINQKMIGFYSSILSTLGLIKNVSIESERSPFGALTGIRGQNKGPPSLAVIEADKSTLPSLNPKEAKSAAAAADQVETYIKSLQKLAAAEAAEAATLGLGNKAKIEAVDLAKALEAARERGTPLTAKETAQVKALADAYSASKDKIEDFKKAEDSAKATAEFFGQTLEGAVEKLATGGGSLRSALKDIVKLLEQAAIKALILGEGPLASLLGTAGSGKGGAGGLGGILGQLLGAFLPKFAEGGDLPAGRFGIVGERGPELIQGPAAITPFRQIDAALNSGGGGRGGAVNNARTFNIDARGAQAGVSDQIMAAIKQYDAQLSRNLPTKLAHADRRYG